MKRVLIIAYYWPPAGGPGVQRWLKFVKYFRDFGIEPVMYVPENPHYPIIDKGFVTEIPKNIEILKTPIKEPYKYAKLLFKKKTKKISSGIIDEKDPSFVEKLMLYARGNWFIPDARVGWVKPSVSYLKKYFNTNKDIDTIITTGPPHSLHLIGMQLKKELGLRWIADFRDPWTSIHYHKSLKLSPSSARKHKKLEKNVLEYADSVVVTSPSTQREFEGISQRKVHVITNGFDGIEMDTPSIDSKFSLVHVGSLLTNRNPKILWEVLAELAESSEAFKNALEIKLVGLVAKEVKKSLYELGLTENLNLTGYLPHEEAVGMQKAAQVLLLIEMNTAETKAILPGKLYEYMYSRRPIIALGPEGSDIASILEDTKGGMFFHYSEKNRLKSEIITLFEAFQKGGVPEQKSVIEGYSRRNLTKAMAELILL